MIRHGRYEHATWYRYLNAGYRLPLVGGTDKMSSDTPVASCAPTSGFPPMSRSRTTSGAGICASAGRSRRSGLLSSFSVNGAEIGDTVALPAGGGTVEIHARAEFTVPDPRPRIDPERPGGGERVLVRRRGWLRSLELRETIKVGRELLVRGARGGPGYWQPLRHHDEWNRGIFAHTSPCTSGSVDRGGNSMRRRPATSWRWSTAVSSTFRDPSPQYPEGSVTHFHGEADHRAYVERPFHEADLSRSGWSNREGRPARPTGALTRRRPIRVSARSDG